MGRAAPAQFMTAKGSDAVSQSVPLLLVKESASEARGDLYSARRFLYRHAPASNDRDMLSRWANLEDWYGSQAPEAYSRLLNTLLRENAPKEEILEICRRGLQVGLRDERFDAARRFATKSADLGDSSALELLPSNASVAGDRVTIPGGVIALNFLVSGEGKPNLNRFLVDYSRVLSSIATNPDGRAFRSEAHTVHQYFQQLSALAALGSRQNGRIKILLTLNDEEGEQRTRAAFSILGLNLTRGNSGFAIELNEGTSQAKRKDTRAALALAIDKRGIEEALSSGKPYLLEIPFDSVPVYPAEHVWHLAFGQNQDYPGGVADILVSDPRLCRLYLALNAMDRAAAEALMKAVPLRALAERYSQPLSLFAASFARSNGRAEVPGGEAADSIWKQLVGESPSNPAAFFLALLNQDKGRLVAFFDAISHLDLARQRFFTRSPDRIKRFYELFRNSPEMRGGGAQRLFSSALLEFLSELPLDNFGRVAFPGSPEVWMLVKGGSESAASTAKTAQALKCRTRPVSDDAVLIHLAATEYKTGGLKQSELLNFNAVSRLNRQRRAPLTPESALLLAQSYPKYGAFFPYLSVVGDLDTADFHDAFTLVAKLDGLDFATANIRLGEFHSYMAMLCLIEQSGQRREEIQRLYRRGIKRYSMARDAAGWTAASLDAIDDLRRLVSSSDINRRDAEIRALLIGAISPNGDVQAEPLAGYQISRDKAYRGVLSLQRVPSIDALFAIRDSLGQLPNDPAALERIRNQISRFVTIVPAYRWAIRLQKQQCFQNYQTANLEVILSKLHDEVVHRNGNSAQIEKLSARLLAGLEPWVELAMAGQIYARYLDPSDLVVSADPLLLRKHSFAGLQLLSGKRTPPVLADFSASSSGQGSYFSGGFAAFSLAAGQARAKGNHLGSPWGEAVAGALFASVRATDWGLLTESGLQTFGANVRLAREWIVEAASSEAMRQQVEEQSMGVLSLTRRKALLTGIVSHDWDAVWESVSISDLYFLGKSLIDQAPASLWATPALVAMKRIAMQPELLDPLGQVAPDLSGSTLPRLQHYQPYEEYERYSVPQPIAERVAELKLYLAWLADSVACRPAKLPLTASLTADAVAKRISMQDMWDWSAVLDEFRRLEPQILGSLGSPQ